jgi:hypothetical protein
MPFQSQAQWRWAFATDQEFADRWAKMTPGGKRRFALLAKRKRTTTKHLPGKHNQADHGKPGRVGSAFRGAYSAARAGGASHVEARNQAKTAAEQVREQMRAERREQAAANPKPKRTAPPRAETPGTTKWQTFLDKSKAEFAAAQDAYQAAMNDKNATMESLTAAQRARDAAGEKWTRDQFTANQMAAVESAPPPPRTETPAAPITPTSKRAQMDAETSAKYDRIRARAERRVETGIDERTGKKLTRQVRAQEEANLRAYEEATGETIPYLQRIRDMIAPEITTTRLGGIRPDAIPKTREITSRISETDRTITATNDRRNAARQRELDARARLAKIRLSNGKGIASNNSLLLAEQDYRREQTARLKLDDELKQLDKDRKAQARELAQAEREVGNTTKADDSVGGVPRKYGARAGEVITGNLGRDTGGKFARVGSNEGAIVRAAINRGVASAGGGKRGAKRAAVSDAQKRRQQADTGASSMDTLGFDASDYDFIAGDKPQDASDPQFARLIEQGLMDNVDGQAYPSALGRKIAAAAGAGDIDKAQELLARDRAKRTERQAKMDAQIQAYDDIISDETASPRARAIAARKRTILIGKSDTSTKASRNSVNLHMHHIDDLYAIITPDDIAGAYDKRINDQDGPEGRDEFKAELIAIAKRKGPDFIRKLPKDWREEARASSTKEHAMFGTLIARLKHMPGKHNQASHGKPGRVGSAFRGAYSAARAGGASHVEARNQAKTAAEQVREQMRAERREQAAANPKPKRTRQQGPTLEDVRKQFNDVADARQAIRKELYSAKLYGNEFEQLSAADKEARRQKANDLMKRDEALRIQEMELNKQIANHPQRAAEIAQAVARQQAEDEANRQFRSQQADNRIAQERQRIADDIAKLTASGATPEQIQLRQITGERDVAGLELLRLFPDDAGFSQQKQRVVDKQEELQLSGRRLIEQNKLAQTANPTDVDRDNLRLIETAHEMKKLYNNTDASLSPEQRLRALESDPQYRALMDERQSLFTKYGESDAEFTARTSRTNQRRQEENDDFDSLNRIQDEMNRTNRIPKRAENRATPPRAETPATPANTRPPVDAPIAKKHNERLILNQNNLVKAQNDLAFAQAQLQKAQAQYGNDTSEKGAYYLKKAQGDVGNAQERVDRANQFIAKLTTTPPEGQARTTADPEIRAFAESRGIPDHAGFVFTEDWKSEIIQLAAHGLRKRTKSRWFEENSEGIEIKADDSYTPPAGVQAQAKRGLALRSEFGRGGTPVGIARARDLSNGKSVSRDTIMRMVSFFARHAVDKRPDWSNPSKPSNGYIAHLLWGGDAGRTWANSIAKRIKANE